MARLLIPDLQPGTQFYVQVRAVDRDSASEFSRKFSFVTTSDNTPPDTITWASSDAWVVSGDAFVATWQAIDTSLPQNMDFDHYELEVGNGVRTSVVLTNNTSFTLTFEQNQIYFGTPSATVTARVRSVDRVGNVSAWNTLLSATNPAPAPVNSISTNPLYDSIQVSWDAGTLPDDFSSFLLQVSTTSASAGFSTVYNGADPTFTHPTTQYVTNHWFKVFVRDKFGSLSSGVTSSAVKPKNAYSVDSTAPNAPTSVTASTSYNATRQESYIDVSWPAISNPENDLAAYVIRYSNSTSGPWNYVKVDKDTLTARLTVTPGQPYYVGVRTEDWSANKSAYVNAGTYPITSAVDTAAPSTPTGLAVAASNVLGTNFVATWNANTENDFKEYELGIVYSGGTEVFYRTTARRFDFTLDQNKSAFTTPRPVLNFRVRAWDDNGNVSSFTSVVTGAIAAPAAPTALSGVTGANSIQTSWTPSASTTVIGYNVYQGTAANPTTLVGFSNTTYYVVTVSTTVGQYFTVKAVDAFGQESVALSGGPYSATNPFLVDTTPPAVPTSLAATLSNNTNGVGQRASVTWANGAETDRAGIELSFKRHSDTVWTSVFYGKDATSAIVDLSYAYTAYDFRIRAFDNSGNFSAWSATLAKGAIANVAPSNVTGLSAVSTTNSITYTWTLVADADVSNYELTFSTSSTFASGNITYYSGNSNTITVSGLSPDTTYYARVRAVDSAGLTSAAWSGTAIKATSPYSSGLSDGVAPASSPAPSVLGGIGYLFVSWAPVTNNDPVTYEVHISTISGFTPTSGTKVAEISGTIISLEKDAAGTALAYGTTYYVKTIAKDVDGAATASSQGSGQISKADTADIAVGAITASSAIIANAAVTSANIQDAAITTAKIDNLAVTNAQIADATITNAKIADLSVSKLTAGTVGSGVGITMAAGSSILLNGGSVYSNTYSTSGGTSGFSLSDSGLIIRSGDISAAALTTGTISGTNTITLSGSNAKIVAGSWSLSGDGLTIPNGAITASKLNITIGGDNLISGSNWSNGQTNGWGATSGTLSISSTVSYWGGYSIKLTTAGTIYPLLVKALPNSMLKPNTTYQFSAWVYVPSSGGVAYLSLSTRNINTSSPSITEVIVGNLLPAYDSWKKITVTFTTLASMGTSDVSLYVWAPYTPAAGLIWYTGAVSVTEGDIAPAYSPRSDDILPGTIVGNMIQANTIDAASLAANTVITQNLSVGNSLIVGLNATDASSLVRSYNWTGTGSTVGWGILGNGTAYFQNATVKGTINATGGSFSGSITASGTITGGTFTGGTVQTSTTATTNGVVINSTGIKGYGASTQKFFLDASNGNLTLTGATSIGGTLVVSGATTLNSTLTVSSGSITGGGWTLNSSGMTIPAGAISAGSLSLQNSQNIISPAYADFEFPPTYYKTNVITSQPSTSTVSVVTDTTAKYNSQCLQFRNTATGTTPIVYLSTASTAYNIANMEFGKSYIISAWVRNPLASAISVGISTRRASDAVFTNVVANTALALSSTSWTRISGVFTPAASDRYLIAFTNNAAAAGQGFDIDAIQIEEKITNSSAPSTWTPPSSTTIDGGQIRTGAIASTAFALDENGNQMLDASGNPVPAWSINTAGNAVLGDAWILGNIIVGDQAYDGTQALPSIRSYNYDENLKTGWSINSDGSAVFRNAIISSDALVDGNLTAAMSIQTGGAIIASGIHGESVELNSDGFTVHGAEQQNIISVSITSNIATIVTASPHGFIDAATDADNATEVIIRGVDDYLGYTSRVFDGTYIVATSPTTSSFTYALDSSHANVTSTAVSATVLGESAYITTGPTLIDFPTDASNPNIISGTMITDNISVNQSLSISGQALIGANTTMFLTSTITTPTSKPVLTWTNTRFATYPMQADTSHLHISNTLGMCRGHDGDMRYLQIAVDDDYDIVQYIGKMSLSSGAVGSKVVNLPYTTSDDGELINFFSIQYDSVNNLYYVLVWYRTNANNPFQIRIYAYDTTFTTKVQDYLVVTEPSLGRYQVSNNGGWAGAGLGYDYINNKLIVVIYDMSSHIYRKDSFTLGATGISGRDGLTAMSSTWLYGQDGGRSPAPGNNPTFLGPLYYGNFDYGTPRYVAATGQDVGIFGSYHWVEMIVTDSSYTRFKTQEWTLRDPKKGTAMSANSDLAPTFYDTGTSQFYTIGQDGVVLIYESGSLQWNGGSTYIRYSWYDSNTAGDTTSGPGDGTHETLTSTSTSVVWSKRQRMNITIPQIPFSNGLNDIPNAARLYIYQGQTDMVNTSSNYQRVGTINYPSTSMTLTPGVTPSGAPPTSNQFSTISSKATIQTTSGRSFWSGDDTAQFSQLVLVSTSDVSTGAGNKPALRIGDTGGVHMRFDGNEIQGMSGDSTVGLVLINQGGGNFQVGSTATPSTAHFFGGIGLRNYTGNDANGVNAASGWSLDSQTFRVFGDIVFCNFNVTRTGGTISNTGSGNIANTTIANFRSGYTPRFNTNLGSGLTGRLAAFVAGVDGTISIVAVGGTTDITSGESFSVGGFYLIN